MNNIIFVITNEIMHCNYNDAEIKCKGYSYCYDEETNELKRKDTIIKFPKPKRISTNKEIKNEVNKYISDINNGLEINRKYAFKKMGLCEGTFDIIDKYFKWRAKTYLNENISIKQFEAKMKLAMHNDIDPNKLGYLQTTSKKLKIDIFDLLEMDSDTLNFLYKINPGKIVIHRDPENANQNTFDFIYVPINVCYCNFDIEKRNKWIKENSRRLFEIALIRLKNDRSFKKFDIPTNFLKATMRIDRDGTALFIFELKDELNNLI